MNEDKDTLIYLADVRIDELEAENAKLREELEAAKHDLQVFSANLARLGAENVKLRELVEYMHRCFVRGHDWGPYCEGETVWVEQRMRELGIEVDGCE